MTDELISRKAAIEAVIGYERFSCIFSPPMDYATDRIREIPSADAEMIVHGKWVPSKFSGIMTCSVCKDCLLENEWITRGKWNYCPNCGAKMDKGGKLDG